MIRQLLKDNRPVQVDLQPIFDWLAEVVAEGIARAHKGTVGEGGQEDHQKDADFLLNADQVAELLKIPARGVYELAKSGKLPSVRIGRLVRFRRGAIKDWIAGLEGGANE